MSRPRIAIAQISCESNTFTRFSCDLEMIRKTGYLLTGGDVLDLRTTGTEVAGMLSALSGAEICPLIASRWNSSAVLAAEAYLRLKEMLLKRLRTTTPVDGVVISCHGSMVVEDVDDPEGDLAQDIRHIVGPGVPIAMTLDLHANVTQQMVGQLDFITGYETYPHIDSAQTGERAASLVMRAITGKIRPATAHVRIPMIQTAYYASTVGDGPFARIMAAAKALETMPRILTTSVFMVGSYIDVPEMGCSALVTADRDMARAESAAQSLAERYWACRQEFLVPTVSVAEAVRRGRQCPPGPVLLLDTADTTGGGAAGDSIDLVAELLEAQVSEPCLATVVDPAAAQECHRRGAGSTVTLSIGHQIDPRWGSPIKLSGVVTAVSAGRFRYTGGVFGGTDANMGPSAVLQVGPISLLIQSLPTYEFADEHYQAAGLRAEAARFVGAKNMMNFRRGYGDVMTGHFVLDLPGPTPPDMRSLPFERIRGPWYPATDIPFASTISRRPSSS